MTETSKICTVVNLTEVMKCAKLQDKSFRSYDFTGVRISTFLLIWAWQLQQEIRCCSP